MILKVSSILICFEFLSIVISCIDFSVRAGWMGSENNMRLKGLLYWLVWPRTCFGTAVCYMAERERNRDQQILLSLDKYGLAVGLALQLLIQNNASFVKF